MKSDLAPIFELCRDPMVVIENEILTYMNPAAIRTFPQLTLKQSAAGLLPDHVLYSQSGSSVTTGVVNDVAYTISVYCRGTRLYLSFTPLVQRKKDTLLSDGVIMQMLSSVFNANLAGEQIMKSLENELSEENKQYFCILARSCHLLNRQISNLDAAIHLRNNNLFCSVEQLDIVPLLSGLIESVSALLGDDSPTLDFSASSDSLLIWADGGMLSRLLLNLLSNSLKNTAAGGSIHVQLSSANSSAVITVTDDGCGIPAEMLPNIFSCFEESLHSLSQPITGGLGLGIARGIAQAHGGALVIESRAGAGTSVRVMLPINPTNRFQLSSGSTPYAPSPRMILTELADTLEANRYLPRWLD